MSNKFEDFPVHHPEHQRPSDYLYYENLNSYYSDSSGTNIDKLRNFTKYVPISEINRFLAKEKLFQQILTVQGSIVECGVFNGGGIFSWMVLSSIYEPLNHLRKIIGFDTFNGLAGVSEKDIGTNNDLFAKEGSIKAGSKQDLEKCASIMDIFRPLGHIPKLELVEGDANVTINNYIKDNPHLIISLLYLDFDIYEPTKNAINSLVSRMPKGSIIAFDQLNQKKWPGETLALLDTIGVSTLKLQRFTFQPQISYAVL